MFRAHPQVVIVHSTSVNDELASALAVILNDKNLALSGFLKLFSFRRNITVLENFRHTGKLHRKHSFQVSLTLFPYYLISGISVLHFLQVIHLDIG